MTFKKNLNKNTLSKSSQNKNNFFGGSVSSDLVMNLLTSNDCNNTLIEQPILQTIQDNFIVSNYGSSFFTTGGGQKKKSEKNKKKNNFFDSFFSKSLKKINNYFQEKVSYNDLITKVKTDWNKNNKKNNYKLDNKNTKHIINDLVKSNYSIHQKQHMKGKTLRRNSIKGSQKFRVNKIGGSKTMLPLKWFDNYYADANHLSSNKNCPQSATLPSYYETNTTIKNTNKSCSNKSPLNGGGGNGYHSLDWTQDTSGTGYRTNGDSTWMGSNIPGNINQSYNNLMNGKTSIFTQPESSILNSNAQYQCTTNNCNITYLKPIENPKIEVLNIDSNSKYSLSDTTSGYIYPSSMINNAEPISFEAIPNLRA